MDSFATNFDLEAASYSIEEQHDFKHVLDTFKNYRSGAFSRVEKSETYLRTLPPRHQVYLKTYEQDLQTLRLFIEHNAQMIDIMTKGADTLFENDAMKRLTLELEDSLNMYGSVFGKVSDTDVEQVQRVLKQIMRDWSEEGTIERTQCYGPIIDEIKSQFSNNELDARRTKILIPGSGLGRLTYELSSLGFDCQANDNNMFMLIVSNFLLNRCRTANEFTIYPWVLQFVNNLTIDDQITPVHFPDIVPRDASDILITAGDFLEVYKLPDEWNCVVTCFFIDCAHNIVAFIEKIYDILKPGGIWINLGPLYYPFAGTDESIEPSFENVKSIIKELGFEMEKCQTNVQTSYCQNPRLMRPNEYHSVFFLCRKPIDQFEDCSDYQV